jgi:hypothetical protein
MKCLAGLVVPCGMIEVVEGNQMVLDVVGEMCTLDGFSSRLLSGHLIN